MIWEFIPILIGIKSEPLHCQFWTNVEPGRIQTRWHQKLASQKGLPHFIVSALLECCHSQECICANSFPTKCVGKFVVFLTIGSGKLEQPALLLSERHCTDAQAYSCRLFLPKNTQAVALAAHIRRTL